MVRGPDAIRASRGSRRAGSCRISSTEEQTMYFLLSKTLGALLTPTTFITALGLAGLVLLCLRLGRWGRVLVTAAVVLLVIGALTPIGYFLVAPLENRFPVWNASEGR